MISNDLVEIRIRQLRNIHRLVYTCRSNPLEADKPRQLDGLALELRVGATAPDQPATPVGAACDGWLWYCFSPALFALHCQSSSAVGSHLRPGSNPRCSRTNDSGGVLSSGGLKVLLGQTVI